MIELKNICKNYETRIAALKNINLTIQDGEIFGIIGQSGAGKSTLIRCINMLETPTSGQIIINGKDLTTLSATELRKERRQIGMIFQHFNLLSNRTVYENIAYAMEVIGENRRNIKKRVMEVLDLVGLKHKVRSFPNELSGGEQQRIAIARAIVNNPKVLIADEPTGNLDPDNSWEIMNLLERINLQGTTVLMATHNSQIVNTLRHRVIAIENGRVVRDEAKGEYGYDD